MYVAVVKCRGPSSLPTIITLCYHRHYEYKYTLITSSSDHHKAITSQVDYFITIGFKRCCTVTSSLCFLPTHSRLPTCQLYINLSMSLARIIRRNEIKKLPEERTVLIFLTFLRKSIRIRREVLAEVNDRLDSKHPRYHGNDGRVKRTPIPFIS